MKNLNYSNNNNITKKSWKKYKGKKLENNLYISKTIRLFK